MSEFLNSPYALTDALQQYLPRTAQSFGGAAPIVNSPVTARLAPDAGLGISGNSFLDGLLGKTLPDGTKIQGWGGLALGAGQGLMNAFLGMQQYGLAKKTLEENKRQFQLNYDAQRTTTNAALEDRQRARLAANPSAYESLSSYMDKNRIK